MHNEPQMMTIRQVARTGVLTEHALRALARDGRLPCIYIGRRCLINYTALVDWLNNLDADTRAKMDSG